MTDLLSADELPPIPDVPYVIGVGAEHRHAIDVETARRVVAAMAESSDPRADWTHAECGQPVVLARKAGEFRRDNRSWSAAATEPAQPAPGPSH